MVNVTNAQKIADIAEEIDALFVIKDFLNLQMANVQNVQKIVIDAALEDVISGDVLKDSVTTMDNVNNAKKIATFAPVEDVEDASLGSLLEMENVKNVKHHV